MSIVVIEMGSIEEYIFASGYMRQMPIFYGGGVQLLINIPVLFLTFPPKIWDSRPIRYDKFLML